MLSPFSDLLFFFDHVSMHPVQTIAFFLLGLGFAFIILVLVWDTFVPVGRLLGRAIADHPRPLRASNST